MALDKNKLVAEATKHVQKGQWDKAIRAYEKILAEDPKDVRVLLKIGELQQKKGDLVSAADTLHRVAQAYTDQGFFLKAVAVYKQVAKLTPGEVRVHQKLASLYQQLGIVSDAMAQLQLVAQALEAAGDEKELLEVLVRMVELDPDNASAAAQLGELHAKAGAVAAALEQLRRAAGLMKRANRLEDYARVAERISTLDPADLALPRELANLYLGRGDTKRALAKLQLCFKADPQDTETLGLLASAFRDLGQLSKTASVYKELAHVEEERGRPAQARAAWRRVLEVVPDDAEAIEALAAEEEPAAAPEPDPQAVAAPADVAAPAVASAPRGPVRPPMEVLPKLLQETEVFAKYGLYRKALEHLDKVFAADPAHLEARERARDLCASSGDLPSAIEHGARVVQIAVGRSDVARATAAFGRLAELAPADERLAGLRAALDTLRGGAAGGEPTAELAELELELEFEAEPELEAEAGVGVARGVAGEVAVAAEAGTGTGTGMEAEFAAAEAGPSPAADLAPELKELDFFLEQGLLDDAREALANLLPLYPAHPGLLARDAEVRRRLPPPPSDGPPPRSDGLDGGGIADGTFDLGRELAAELGDELGGAPPSPARAGDGHDVGYAVSDVLRQLDGGARTVNAQDGETHYDLAMAYRQMGMLDDAIREFEVALAGRPPRDPVDCHTMIGLCRLEKGDAAGAVAAYRSALATGAVSQDAARALHYDLARAHQTLGDEQGALWYLHKVLREDARFRDARELVTRLGGGPGRAPPGDQDLADVPRRVSAKRIGFV